jgi:hypothetical protein
MIMADDKSFNYRCQCGKIIKIPTQLVDKKAVCPSCKIVFTASTPPIQSLIKNNILWHYSVKGLVKGPFSQIEISELISNGQLGAKDLVWKKGMAGWLIVEKVPEFRGLILAPKVSEKKQPMPPAPDNFFGREQELATLRQLWDQATTKDANNGPRMAIILAETGYGKTRLIQALYQQLTKDPLWDPAEINYWPDAFQEVSNQLRVNPDMAKHSPKGPPRFLWAGMRWSSPEEKICPLPEIRDVLRTHVEISKQHSDIWTKLKAKAGKAIKTDGISEATEQIVDFLGIPFGGLLLKGVKAIGNLATAKSSHSFKEESEKKATDITEELLNDFREIFGSIGSGGIVLPTILFLDDAQWIDPITFKFIGQLWREADSKKWPLFVVITHWERNWRELLKKPENEHESSLAYFKEKKGVHLICLKPSSEEEQKSYLRQKLAGLTESQKNLILGKSGGNFLILVQNVGFLLQNKLNFENGDFQGGLSKSGENRVNNWKPNPNERIEQMFASLSEETKNLLGWSSQLGIRFIENVVIDFANKQGVKIELNRLIDECIDPLVILGKASENIREFRHRAFYHVASQHFRNYLSDSEGLLKSTLQKHLSQWVNNSFTSEGCLVEVAKNIEKQNAKAAICLEPSERRDLLEMTVREFMTVTGQAKDRSTWIRSVYLLVKIDSEDNLWDLVLEKGNLLKEVDWNELSNSVLNLSLRESLADSLETSGAIRSAKRIRLNVLHQQKLLNEELNTSESLRDVSNSFFKIGDIEVTEGNLNVARILYAKSLEIRRKLAKQLNTPDSLRDFTLSLERIGDIELEEGNLGRARTLFSECLDISRKLAEQLNTPKSLRDVSASLGRLGYIEREEGKLDRARTLYAEGLQIIRKLAEQLKTPESLSDVSAFLVRIGNLEQIEGNLKGARPLFAESLEIRRKLAEQLNTPDSLSDVSSSLVTIGDIEEIEGNLDIAKKLYSESLEIRRKLAKQLKTPDSLRDVVHSLSRFGDIEKAEGNLDTARTLYAECLELSRKLAEQLNTPDSLSNVSAFLVRIGDIEEVEKNLDTARTLYAEGLEISRKLAKQLNTPDSLRDVFVSLTMSGKMERAAGNLDTARTLYTECLEISRKLAEQLNTPQSLNDVSISLEEVGGLELAEGNLKVARPLFAESLEIRRKLAEQLNTPQSLRDVSISLEDVGDLELEEGNLDCARTLHSESLEIRRKLAEQLNTPKSLRDVSAFLVRIGGIEQAEGNLKYAKELYSEGLEIRRKLAEQLNTPDSLSDVSISLNRIGDIEQAEGNLEGARTLYSEGLEISRKLAEQLNTPDFLQDVYVLLERIGDIDKAEGNLERARIWYSESLEIRRKLAEQLNTPIFLRDLSYSLGKIGYLEQIEGNLDTARTLVAEGLEISRKLAEQLNTPDSLSDVSAFLESIEEIDLAIRNEIENKKSK